MSVLENVKVEIDLSNHPTEADVDTSTLASKTDLVSLKTKVYNLDEDNSRLSL